MKVLCIGLAVYDITLPLEEFPIENTKNRVSTDIECVGGPTSNAGAVLAKYREEVYFAGLVGNDTFGNIIKNKFIEEGINIKYLEMRDNYKTPTAIILSNIKSGSRTVMTVRDNSKMNSIDIDIKPDFILIDGQEEELSKKVIEENKNAISIIDAGSFRDNVDRLCYIVDYVVCSYDFFTSSSGIKVNTKEEFIKAYQILKDKYKTNIIVTLGHAGSAYIENDELIYVPSIKVDTKDTTGAGDIFHGAFIYGLIKKMELKEILKFANIAGALSTTKIGGRNSILDLESVMKVYERYK